MSSPESPHVRPAPLATSFPKTEATPGQHENPLPFPRIGVTMRLLRQPGTGDVHDALSQDWGRFFAAAGLVWAPLPNRGAESLALARALDLTGFLFSGGGEAGAEPARDTTERLLLEHARAHGLPVLGICRGFQALQRALGGDLVPVADHVAVHHPLLASGPLRDLFDGRNVNSYHQSGIARLASGLRPLALSRGEDSIEAAYGDRLLGLMWHPEREPMPHEADLALVRGFFTGTLPELCLDSLPEPSLTTSAAR